MVVSFECAELSQFHRPILICHLPPHRVPRPVAPMSPRAWQMSSAGYEADSEPPRRVVAVVGWSDFQWLCGLVSYLCGQGDHPGDIQHQTTVTLPILLT